MRASLFALTVGFAAGIATAASAMNGVGQWAEFEGGRARLLADGGASGPTGRAWLEIELQAGWKTYWLEPGDGGVPPSITLEAGGKTIEPDLSMPAPLRFREPNTVWAGYTERTYIAMSYPAVGQPSSTPLRASAFLGICREICIPVTLDLIADGGDGANVSAVAEELRQSASLPEAFSNEGLMPSIARDGDNLTVTFESPSLKGVENAELFVAAAPRGLRLATPEAVSDSGAGRLQFELPILKRKGEIEGNDLDLLLSLGETSYHGKAALPALN